MLARGLLIVLGFLLAASPSPCPEGMVLIPAGSFIMGSDRAERDFGYRIGGEAARRYRWFDQWELPRQEVTVSTYCIQRVPGTNEAYRRFIETTGHRDPFISREDYHRQGYLVHSYQEVERFLWRDGRYPEGTGQHPVVLVSQADAAAYCRWRWRDRSCRLPTEAEWEKAARGTDGRYFPWGNEWRPEYLNAGYRVGYTTTVGSYPRGQSPYGLMDAAGNIFQWTDTDFAEGKAVLKGCSWDDEGGICRSASRHGRIKEARHILFGFRCVCELNKQDGG
ncbi:MAG: formylglycine-generating enzyme family protein [Candidatus Methylomirabilales bacterium]